MNEILNNEMDKTNNIYLFVVNFRNLQRQINRIEITRISTVGNYYSNGAYIL